MNRHYKLGRDEVTLSTNDNGFIIAYNLRSVIDGWIKNIRIISEKGANNCFEQVVDEINKRADIIVEKRSIMIGDTKVIFQQYLDAYIITVRTSEADTGIDFVYHSHKKAEDAFKALKNNCKKINF